MANAKIVILGANGMLGHALLHAFKDKNPIGLRHSDLDITQRAAVIKKISELQPSVIINAAAYTKVDDCETNQVVANKVNGEAPGFLAEAAKAVNATLVQYSTDYVFSGQNSAGYAEDSEPGQPVNAYGASKLLGEKNIVQQVDAQWSNYYIIRTSWLFGNDGPNFVDTMLKLGLTKPVLKVVNDQHGSPTYTNDLAVATRSILDQQLPAGIYHATNSGDCTWYEFAQEIFRLAQLSVVVEPCSSLEFPRPAKRPAFSMLRNTKISALPTWQQALATYLSARSGKA